METVPVPIRKDVFEKLQQLAEPLVDDASSVIARLIAHWEHAKPSSRFAETVAATSRPATVPRYWTSARGEKLLVGTKLRAKYLKHLFEAEVTEDGIRFNETTYDNPSSAGVAAKNAVGTTGKAASTNGWEFWEMLDQNSRRWVSIDAARK
ncbi:MAG: hypothetical protein M5U30_11530 [Burkholderiaceae bacterium]|nr:hypothetical protein [Burkholderiaceae bacterium]